MQLPRFIKRIIPKSEFFKNVVTVMTGTAIAQAIALALTPVLTRNYTPEDFGFLLIYISILTIAGTCSTGKFERVILLVKTEAEIKKLVFLSFFASSIVAVFLFLLLIFGKGLLIHSLALDSSLYKWLFSLPILILVYSSYTVFNTILNYQKQFGRLSTARVLKTIISISGSIVCIFFLNDARGLILGEFLGYLCATIYIVYLNKRFLIFNKSTFKGIKAMALRYKNFPIYNIPSDFMNIGSSQMPAFFLTTYFGAGVTGFYSLMKRVLDAPVTLFSKSVLEVFRQKAAEQYIKEGGCRTLFVKTAKRLAFMSVIPFLILFLLAPKLFSLVFGKEWFVAGEYARIFAIFYYFKFISSPLSYMLYIAEKQKIVFILHLYLFITTIVVFNLPKYTSANEYNLLWIHTVNLILFYITMFIFSLRSTKNRKLVKPDK